MFNHTGYFCCLPGQTGFWTDNPKNAVGCSDGAPTERGESILNTKSQSYESTPPATATTPTSTSSTSTTSISAATTTSSASDSPTDSSSSNHAGAIAGGVIGGVAGVALIAALLWWFFIRGRQRSQPSPPGEGAAPIPSSPQPPAELEARKALIELESQADQPVHELPPERY
ncbi:hypothetical protein BBP40_009445 [Aspergillus hancockii]|nr:hypothetical protein BBP40_009445 [Aspergillus hancockii]